MKKVKVSDFSETYIADQLNKADELAEQWKRKAERLENLISELEIKAKRDKNEIDLLTKLHVKSSEVISKNSDMEDAFFNALVRFQDYQLGNIDKVFEKMTVAMETLIPRLSKAFGDL